MGLNSPRPSRGRGLSRRNDERWNGLAMSDSGGGLDILSGANDQSVCRLVERRFLGKEEMSTE